MYINRIKKKSNNKNIKFQYILNNKIITDNKILEYIKNLSIPPSWDNVKLTYDPNIKIQAIGKDNKNRTQYIYSKQCIINQDKLKFTRLKNFIKIIHNIRNDINIILKKSDWFTEKLICLIIIIIDNYGSRIGNIKYKNLYDTYGITTLLNKHIKFFNNKIILEFIGKKNIINTYIITQKNIIKLILDLYKYNNNNKQNEYFFVLKDQKIITNIIINNYLKQYGNYTIKDFRTYRANIEFIKYLTNINIQNSEYKNKININKCMDKVSIKLNNTRTILKNKYISNIIIEKYLNNPYKFFSKYKYYIKNTLLNLNIYESLLLYYLKLL